MKKIISIFCILLLLIATSNLAVNIHFCGNSISSIDFLGKAKTCGNACNSKASLKEKSCCKNFSTVISTDDSTNSTFSFNCDHVSVAIATTNTYLFIVTPIIQSILKGSISCNAPPNILEQPYYILYNSLII
jgi:hypothetical protein